MGSKCDALESFWRGLESLGEVPEEVLGGSWEVFSRLLVSGCRFIKSDVFDPQVGLHVGPEQYVF